MLLGGRAAEEEVAGTLTDGTGGAIGSDLELASGIATMMEVLFGMGHGLSYTHASTREELDELRRSDLEIRRSVEKILNSELDRAREIVRNSKESVRAVASALMEREILAGDHLIRIIDAFPRRESG